VTLDRHDDETPGEAEHGVLSDAGAVDTAGIGILGTPTAHLAVALPADADDELDEDDVLVDEVVVDELATGDIILEDAGDEHDGSGSDERVLPASDDVEDAEEVRADDTAYASSPQVPRDTDDAVADDDASAPSDERDAEDVVAQAGEADEDDAADADLGESDAGPTESASSPGEDEAQAAAAAPATTGAVRIPIGDPVPFTGSIPTTRREAHQADEAARAGRTASVERVRPAPTELTLAAKRLGEIDDKRESADLLTADRLLDRAQLSGAEPEGLWQQLVYSLSRHRINLGDSRRAKARKELDRRIAVPLVGGARFVPVVSRKGGVGKTTVTTLLGMALAAARDDRVIAVDANPDRGTLADRIARPSGRTVRDLARSRADVTGFNDISTIVARDETRLDVLASDADPQVSEAFSDRDYADVAALAAHYYSIVLTDTGTGIVHSVMGATLDLADQIVVVAGLSVDEARLASETLTWLETNGYAEQVRAAVVVLNTARPGTPLVRENEVAAHFRTRVRAVIRMPYDPLIATGSAISFRELQPATRQAARELAAAVVEGLRTLAPAA
jgi:MinD-like ATPase involved in chromosome partitioning or flagellar assembly